MQVVGASCERGPVPCSLQTRRFLHPEIVAKSCLQLCSFSRRDSFILGVVHSMHYLIQFINMYIWYWYSNI